VAVVIGLGFARARSTTLVYWFRQDSVLRMYKAQEGGPGIASYDVVDRRAKRAVSAASRAAT